MFARLLIPFRLCIDRSARNGGETRCFVIMLAKPAVRAAVRMASMALIAAAAMTWGCDAALRTLAGQAKEPFSWRLGKFWGCRTKASFGAQTLPGMEFHARGVDRLELHCEGEPSPAEWYSDIAASVSFPLGIRHPGLLPVFLPGGRAPEGFQYERSAFGLPFRSSTRERAMMFDSGVREGIHMSGFSVGLIALDAGANSRRARADAIWLPGAAADVLFWTVGVSTVWLAAARCRRWNRRRRAWCVACGYDLGGLAPGLQCPECGRK